MTKFFIGLHNVIQSSQFDRAFISVNRLWERKSAVPCREWIMDSGAFTEVAKNGPIAWTGGRVIRYAKEIERQATLNGSALIAAVAPDLMCEPAMIDKVHVGTAKTHVALTIHNYQTLVDYFNGRPPVHIMPVLQGYTVDDYLHCLNQYGSNLSTADTPASQWTIGLPGERYLKIGAHVGVGSVCKRNSSDPQAIVEVLRAIHTVRPDLKLHGFGVKFSALQHPEVRRHLYSCDSMAWSFAARYEGRNGNDVNEAHNYLAQVQSVLAAA